MSVDARRSAGDPVAARGRLLERIRKLGDQGLSRTWLVAHGRECLGDWQAAIDELVESGLVERRTVYRWGMSPEGQQTTIVYYPRSPDG